MRSRTLTALLAPVALLLGATAPPPAMGQGLPRLLPFPSDAYTVRDRHSATGRRLALARSRMPRNSDGVPMDPTDLNRFDGFSPGAAIVVKVPGLDTPAAFRRNRLVGVDDMARSFARSQRVLLLDAGTGRRQLIWSEVDANASSPAKAALIVHPAVNLVEGRRYVVVLRNLVGADGARLPRAPLSERRNADRRGVRTALRRAHVSTKGVWLAWGFTVASRRSLSERMLHIRDDAFRQLGDTNLGDGRIAGRPPVFKVDQVQDFTPDENANVARRVRGTFTVPCYLNQAGCPPGSRFRLVHGLPRQRPGNTLQANFVCDISRAALTRPGRPVLFGHGLFGSADSVVALDLAANENDLVACGTDWIGMSSGDLGNVATILSDQSRFPTLVDRLQQSWVDFLYLGRLMAHPRGFVLNPAFRPAGSATIVPSRLSFYGISQGGILGGGLAAVAPDYRRAVLDVPAMNFSTLLPRSSAWARFAAVFYPHYPDELSRPLIISLVQTMWDRGEADGYARHLTKSPYPDTPVHRVLILEAFGDHTVANVATEVEARTIGARLRTPVLDPGRSNDRRPFYGIRRLRSFHASDSVLEVWDSGPLREGGSLGTPPPPPTDVPPSQGKDPHGRLLAEPGVRRQAAAFMGGRFPNVCGGRPCYSAGWAGP